MAVEDVRDEIGDYVNPGQSCATIVDLNPMLMVGRVSEKAVMELQLGQLATLNWLTAVWLRRYFYGNKVTHKPAPTLLKSAGQL